MMNKEAIEEDVNLKPCPFCGSKNIEVFEKVDYSGDFIALCNLCGVQTTSYESEEDAANAWNQRS